MTFEKILDIENEFIQNVTYNATGFILNMTKGITSEFNTIPNDNQRDNENILEKAKNEIIPKAQSLSIVETNQNKESNSDIAEILLVLGALGILFGGVYGVKRQVDSNSRQISINKDSIKKKIIHPIRGSNPKEIIQTRLAKGEITLEEYEQIERKLDQVMKSGVLSS